MVSVLQTMRVRQRDEIARAPQGDLTPTSKREAMHCSKLNWMNQQPKNKNPETSGLERKPKYHAMINY